MTKRARITALITTLCICISLFVVGVLAATTASLSVTSTLKFSADGVYVMVDASLKQGADVETAQVLSGEGKPTGQTTYKAYSYPRETGQDYPNGEPSTKHFVDSTGAQASTWAIGDITYSSENVVVVYEFLVSNYSEFEVTGTVEGISEALAGYTDQLSITTYTGTSSADATATGSPTYTFNIPARTSEIVPGQTCYKIAVTLNKFTSDITTETIQIDVSFTLPPEPVYDYFTYSVNSIIGLSDTYLNLETKPETLVIPSTDGEGNDIIYIGGFDDLASNNIIIQEGVEMITDTGFSRCTSITSLTLPDSLTSINLSAFFGCSNLKSINIPKGVTSIGSSAFSSCIGLEAITVSEENTVYYSVGNCLIEKATKTLVFGCKNSILPEDLLAIGDYAFEYNTSLTNLTIPKNVTSIGTNAFLACSNLKSVIFEDYTGWSHGFDSSGTNMTPITDDLSDPVTAATCLKSKYISYWKKS